MKPDDHGDPEKTPAQLLGGGALSSLGRLFDPGTKHGAQRRQSLLLCSKNRPSGHCVSHYLVRLHSALLPGNPYRLPGRPPFGPRDLLERALEP